MGGRVCIVVEHCRAINDEFESYDENRAVAGNPTIAENLIEGYKNDLIKEVRNNGGTATETTIVGGDITVMAEFHGNAVTYMYDYSWEIEQFDIVES